MIEQLALFSAGAASTKITPDEPMWLAGFAVRTEPSKGILSDLFAKALAIKARDGNRVVIVSVDLIAIPRPVAQKVAGEAHTRFGLSRDQLLLCATHTHYGPELRPDKVPFFHIPPEYAAKIQPFADRLAEVLIECIGAALERMRPSELRFKKGRASFAANRRNPDDLVDHEVPILTAEDAGILIGYACHNTTMPPADCLYSADWAGFATEQIGAICPGMTALFLAGAGADQNPEKGSAELSYWHGSQLVDALLKGGNLIFGPSIETAFAEAELDYQPIPSRQQLEADLAGNDQPKRTKAQFLLEKLARGEQFDTSYPCPIQVIRIGAQVLMIAIGGEPVIDYAVNLKKEFGNRFGLVWVVGYANDMFGYVPTPRVLAGGGYEGTRSVLWSALPMPFTDSVEERVLTTIRQLVAKLNTD